MVVAPAVVTLLGDRAWTLPAWLDRILPSISLEDEPDDEARSFCSVLASGDGRHG